MFPSVIPPHGGATSSATVRLTWPEAFVIAMALGLTIFLYVRDTPFVAAAAISVATMTAFVGLIAIARGVVGEMARNRRLLHAAAGELARLHSEQEGRR